MRTSTPVVSISPSIPFDAQREACEVYILSQRHKGWHIVSARYDDGGFSGGNMELSASFRMDAGAEALTIYGIFRTGQKYGGAKSFPQLICSS